MALEVREKLRQFCDKRIKVRGALDRSEPWTTNYVEVGRTCIRLPEREGDVLAHHVWVMGTKNWDIGKDDQGRMVEFSALVKSYRDGRLNATNYHLINPQDFRVLDDPPRLRIPEEVEIEDDVVVQAPITNGVKEQVVVDPLETFKVVRGIAKACGVVSCALLAARAINTYNIALPELIRWLEVLKEEPA